jgi:hypothetical protein
MQIIVSPYILNYNKVNHKLQMLWKIKVIGNTKGERCDQFQINITPWRWDLHA